MRLPSAEAHSEQKLPKLFWFNHSDFKTSFGINISTNTDLRHGPAAPVGGPVLCPYIVCFPLSKCYQCSVIEKLWFSGGGTLAAQSVGLCQMGTVSIICGSTSLQVNSAVASFPFQVHLSTSKHLTIIHIKQHAIRTPQEQCLKTHLSTLAVHSSNGHNHGTIRFRNLRLTQENNSCHLTV